MFTLIDLPYAPDALEPAISARTLSFHHGKHLQTYVDNLNKLLPGSPYEGMALEEIVRKADGGIFNNAGQILNHNLYFTQFKPASAVVTGSDPSVKPGPDLSVMPDPDSSVMPGPDSSVMPGPDPSVMPGPDLSVMPGPTGHLKAQIEKQWGSIDAFKAEFEAKGVGLFGSGWVWLSAAEDGSLVITQEAGAGNPLTRGLRPLLTFDVWEHAYYLDFQNRRAAQLAALWAIVDWAVVEKRYEKK